MFSRMYIFNSAGKVLRDIVCTWNLDNQIFFDLGIDLQQP